MGKQGKGHLILIASPPCQHTALKGWQVWEGNICACGLCISESICWGTQSLLSFLFLCTTAQRSAHSMGGSTQLYWDRRKQVESHVLHANSDYRATPPNAALTFRLQRQISTHWKWWWKLQAASWQRLEIKVYFNSTPEAAWTLLESKPGLQMVLSRWFLSEHWQNLLPFEQSVIKSSKTLEPANNVSVSQDKHEEALLISKHKTLERELIWVKFWYCPGDKPVVPLEGIKTDLPQLASGVSESKLEIHLHRLKIEQQCWGSETDDTEE